MDTKVEAKHSFYRRVEDSSIPQESMPRVTGDSSNFQNKNNPSSGVPFARI